MRLTIHAGISALLLAVASAHAQAPVPAGESADEATTAPQRPARPPIRTEAQKRVAAELYRVEGELLRVESELAARQGVLDGALAEIRREREESSTELESAWQAERRRLESRHERALARAPEAEHEQLSATHQTTLNELDARHAENLAEVASRQATETQAASDRLSPEIQRLQAEADRLRQEVDTLVVELQRAGLVEARAAEALGLGEAFFRRWFPESLQGEESRLLGLEAWQWIVIGLLLIVAIVVHRVVVRVAHALLAAFSRSRALRIPTSILDNAERPLGILAGSAVFFAVVGGMGLPADAQAVLILATRLVLAMAGTWAAWRMVDVVAAYGIARSRSTSSKLDDLLAPVLRRLLKIAVLVVGLLFVMRATEIESRSLLAGLGLGGFAFALASKDTVENLFGFLTLVMDRSFQVGDWIKVGDAEGSVEEVGLRSTRIRTFYNSLITLPNRQLVNAVLDNMGARSHRRYTCKIGLSYDTQPEQVEAFCEGLRELIRLHPYTRKDYYHVYLNALSDSSLDVLLYVFHSTPDWSTELRERHRLLVDILKLARRLGVSLAFPTSTVHVPELVGISAEDLPRAPATAGPPPSPEAAAVPEDFRGATRAGVRAAFDVASEGLPGLTIPPPVKIRDRPRSRAEEEAWRVLRSLDIFKPLNDDEIRKLAEVGERVHAARGAAIVTEGEPGISMHVISQGVVTLERQDDDGGNLVLHRLGLGQCFGEMSLLTGEPRPATARAETECETIRIPKEALAVLLASRPGLQDDLAATAAAQQATLETRGAEDEDAPSLLERIRSFFDQA